MKTGFSLDSPSFYTVCEVRLFAFIFGGKIINFWQKYILHTTFHSLTIWLDACTQILLLNSTNHLPVPLRYNTRSYKCLNTLLMAKIILARQQPNFYDLVTNTKMWILPVVAQSFDQKKNGRIHLDDFISLCIFVKSARCVSLQLLHTLDRIIYIKLLQDFAFLILQESFQFIRYNKTRQSYSWFQSVCVL